LGCVDPDPGRARREAVESVSRIYAQDFDPLADRYLLHDDPDMVVARLAEHHAAGAGAVIFSAACAGTAPSRDRTVRRGGAPAPDPAHQP
jgi:hypothetical protein